MSNNKRLLCLFLVFSCMACTILGGASLFPSFADNTYSVNLYFKPLAGALYSHLLVFYFNNGSREYLVDVETTQSYYTFDIDMPVGVDIYFQFYSVLGANTHWYKIQYSDYNNTFDMPSSSAAPFASSVVIPSFNIAGGGMVFYASSTYDSSVMYYAVHTSGPDTPTPTPTPSPIPTPSPTASPSGDIIFSNIFNDIPRIPMNVRFYKNGSSVPYSFTYDFRYTSSVSGTPYDNVYFTYSCDSPLPSFEFNSLVIDIPFSHGGFNSLDLTPIDTMYCSFCLDYPLFGPDLIYPSNTSGIIYLCNDINERIVSIPLSFDRYENVFYVKRFAITPTLFDHVEIELFLYTDNQTSSFSTFAISGFLIERGVVIDSSFSDFYDILYSSNGDYSSLITWHENLEADTWSNVSDYSALLLPFATTVINNGSNLSVYSSAFRPAVRTYNAILSSFWNNIGSDTQWIITILIVAGSLATLGGIGAAVVSTVRKKRG